MGMPDRAGEALREAVDGGAAIDSATALAILRCGRDEVPELLAAATAVRRRRFGDRLSFCSIVNAKSGACSEDCAFCAQSARHATGAPVYGLLDSARLAAAHADAARLPVTHFGVVTSGDGLAADEFKRILETVKRNGRTEVAWCASLGSLSAAQLRALKEAGLKRFHHNLETAESFFPNICTTHGYGDRLKTLRACREAGLETCSGGLLGLGESLEQRVELALALQREQVDSIPLNFLMPIPGTRLEALQPVAPLDIIRCTVMFRMTNPRAELKICAGRAHLRDLQSMIFYAGATGMMLGDLLTVAGREVAQDLQMLDDLEVDYAR